MKVLLKKDNLYLKIAWIKRMNDSLIGWTLNNEEYSKNFPSQIKSFDIHYHYPIQGQFHFSYKYFIDDLKYEIRAYKDHLSTKVWGDISDIQTREIFLPDFKNFNEFFLINSSDIVDLKNPDLVKQIAGMGFNLKTQRVLDKIKNYGKKIKPKETDIVLDVDVLGNVCVSYTVVIYNNIENISQNWLNNNNHIRVSDHEKKPFIEMIVELNPYEDTPSC